eukprot:CAMPEP_0167812988 /NCGR_PEP_ID=MMETSP0112_2-20121227/1583_1 /TAXON_ID=91324 /ORGANISM="Lotharella globosa, Strain CCCM811" /LENGTH=296 /DNA_ID=CAMNT_0007711979 /DNA_START=55 /DNA_END=945 /DNA_ORIENTATION=+
MYRVFPLLAGVILGLVAVATLRNGYADTRSLSASRMDIRTHRMSLGKRVGGSMVGPRARSLQVAPTSSTSPAALSARRAEEFLRRYPEVGDIWKAIGPSRHSRMAVRATIQENEEQETDVFRETPLRYLGYANEVGEAFRAFVGANGVLASYAVASGYVVSDAIYQSYKVSKSADANAMSPSGKNMRIFVTGAESLVWQSLASVVVPGFTINRMVALAHFGLDHLYKTDAWAGIGPDTTSQVDHWIPTLFGLTVIPLIMRPIDSSVEDAFAKYVRPPVRKFVVEYEKAQQAHDGVS